MVESVSASLAANVEVGLNRGVQDDIAVGLTHGCAVAQIDSGFLGDGLGLRLFGGCGLVTHVSPDRQASGLSVALFDGDTGAATIRLAASDKLAGFDLGMQGEDRMQEGFRTWRAAGA